MIYVEKSSQNTALSEIIAKEHNIEIIDNINEIDDKKVILLFLIIQIILSTAVLLQIYIGVVIIM